MNVRVHSWMEHGVIVAGKHYCDHLRQEYPSEPEHREEIFYYLVRQVHPCLAVLPVTLEFTHVPLYRLWEIPGASEPTTAELLSFYEDSRYEKLEVPPGTMVRPLPNYPIPASVGLNKAMELLDSWLKDMLKAGINPDIVATYVPRAATVNRWWYTNLLEVRSAFLRGEFETTMIDGLRDALSTADPLYACIFRDVQPNEPFSS